MSNQTDETQPFAPSLTRPRVQRVQEVVLLVMMLGGLGVVTLWLNAIMSGGNFLTP